MNDNTRSEQDGAPDRIATGLGIFSLALGAIEILAPDALDGALGLEGHERLTRLYGAREIGTGLGILFSENPTPWLWARVAGDALDLLSLAAGPNAGPAWKQRAAVAMGSVAAVMALDLYCALATSRRRHSPAS